MVLLEQALMQQRDPEIFRLTLVCLFETFKIRCLSLRSFMRSYFKLFVLTFGSF